MKYLDLSAVTVNTWICMMKISEGWAGGQLDLWQHTLSVYTSTAGRVHDPDRQVRGDSMPALGVPLPSEVALQSGGGVSLWCLCSPYSAQKFGVVVGCGVG